MRKNGEEWLIYQERLDGLKVVGGGFHKKVRGMHIAVAIGRVAEEFIKQNKIKLTNERG